MGGSVIQATGTMEFEDSLRMGVLPGGCWDSCVVANVVEEVLLVDLAASEDTMFERELSLHYITVAPEMVSTFSTFFSSKWFTYF